MQTVKVLKAHTYDGRWRNVGETYKAADQFARVLILLGKVEEYTPPPPPPPKRTYKTRAMKAADDE